MKIKDLTSTALLTFVGMALAISPARALVTYNAGDLLLGFRATGGTGATETYVFNLGSAASYRDASSSFTLTTTIGTDLSNIFGASWFSRSDLFWGIAGAGNNTPNNIPPGTFPTPINGDPSRTLYASRPEDSIGVQSTPWVVSSASQRGIAATDMKGLQDSFKTYTATATSNNLGADIPTSDSNSWKNFNTGSLAFDTFNPSIEGNFGSGTAGTALDLYRVLDTTTGATPSGTVGTGSYEGTFTISNAGAIKYNASPVPEPSTVAMFGIGAVASLYGWMRRRRQLKKA